MTWSEPTGLGLGTTLKIQIVPPKTHSVCVVVRSPSGVGWLGVVVRYPVLFAKTKPEDRPMVGSIFLIGTRDELSMLLSTTYWPLFEAAEAPDNAVKSFLEVVKVRRESWYRTTFTRARAARLFR